MKHTYFRTFSFIISTTLAIFAGCTVKNADKEITMPEEEKTEYQPTLADQEMDFAYGALYFFYLDAEKALMDYEFYQGKGEEAGYSPNRFEYPDIYYMYDQMGDNYTYYVGPYYAEMFGFSNTSEQSLDLGIQVEMLAPDSLTETRWLVTQVYKGAPADQAGLLAGDTILLVGSTNPRDISAFEKMTSGNAGDEIPLKVARGDSTIDVTASLFCYLAPTVFLSYKDSVPVIKITEFAEQTAMACSDVSGNLHGTALEFENFLKATKGPVVIDLRGNLGGDISQCVETSRATLAKGDKMFNMKSTDFSEDSTKQQIYYDEFAAEKDGIGKGRYYVLMADSFSASCSEMMMLAMTTALKTPIVGELSLGKGIGQYYINTPAHGYSVVTAMKIYDLDGNSYHDLGFIPDYEIADSLEALNKAVALAKEGKAKRTHGYGTQNLDHFTNTFAKKAGQGIRAPKSGAYKIIKNLQLK